MIKALQRGGVRGIGFDNPSQKSKPEDWKKWSPAFKDFDVTLSNYNGELWPEKVQGELVDYVKGRELLWSFMPPITHLANGPSTIV